MVDEMTIWKRLAEFGRERAVDIPTATPGLRMPRTDAGKALLAYFPEIMLDATPISLAGHIRDIEAEAEALGEAVGREGLSAPRTPLIDGARLGEAIEKHLVEARKRPLEWTGDAGHPADHTCSDFCSDEIAEFYEGLAR